MSHGNASAAEAGGDFQQAAAAAEAEASVRWHAMSPFEKATAIYLHLRQIDEARATKMVLMPGPKLRRCRVA